VEKLLSLSLVQLRMFRVKLMSLLYGCTGDG
jgi:hypothetical protein